MDGERDGLGGLEEGVYALSLLPKYLPYLYEENQIKARGSFG